jgi:UDPglucose 6-dehydrogenase
MNKPKISVIGLGFVGLTLAVVNAQKGFRTVGIDIDDTKLANLRNGIPDFYEVNLEGFLKNSIRKKTISFSNSINSIIDTNITFVTVGTPTKDGKIDLLQVQKVITEVSKVLSKKKNPHLVVIKSTVVPTTTSNIVSPKFQHIKNVKLVVNPEFLREGTAVHDLLKPHLIVIGEQEKKSGDALIKYYKTFYKTLPEILRTNFTTAELIKYSNNAFLATKISFINSIANICQNFPMADVTTIAYAIGKDPRIGSLFLNAGPGFGGSCLPKDLSALISFSKDLGNVNILLKAVQQVNKTQPEKIIKLLKQMGVWHKNKTISVLGLAFKKNTDDVRESVSISLIKSLLDNGLIVKVHDPMAAENFFTLFQNKITYCDTVKDCLKNSDCCIIMTDWDAYKKLQPADFISLMKTPNIIDARRVFDPAKFSKINFRAIGLGM